MGVAWGEQPKNRGPGVHTGAPRVEPGERLLGSATESFQGWMNLDEIPSPMRGSRCLRAQRSWLGASGFKEEQHMCLVARDLSAGVLNDFCFSSGMYIFLQ